MMPRFRGDTGVVEARRFTPSAFFDVAFWVDEHDLIGLWNGPMAGGPVVLGIRTPEGLARANEGDWVVKGGDGVFYPCADADFRKTYQRVED
jgi:hypothetical protein